MSGENSAVWVIDDDGPLRYLSAAGVRLSGYTGAIVQLETADRAIELYNKGERPTAAVCDNSTPPGERTGLDLLYQMRKPLEDVPEEERDYIPFVLVATIVREQDKERLDRFMVSGRTRAFRYLRKPALPSKIAEAVKEVLAEAKPISSPPSS